MEEKDVGKDFGRKKGAFLHSTHILMYVYFTTNYIFQIFKWIHADIMKKLNTETLGNEKQINMDQIAPQLIEEDLPSARPPTSNSKHRPLKAGV